MNRGSVITGPLDLLAFDIASMRPRFMNRGSSALGGPSAHCGQGFNEAPIHESGKCPALVHIGLCLHASMRPRFMNRGSA